MQVNGEWLEHATAGDIDRVIAGETVRRSFEWPKSPGEHILFQNVWKEGSTSIGVYEASGGYAKLGEWLKRTPEEIIDVVKKSNLRGRGGAGFPTGMKWGFLPKDNPKPRYMCVNADESEPGTYKDRVIVERDPHRLIEAIVVSCHAIRSQTAYIYIRGEFHVGARTLEAALAEARAKGYVGKNILGTGVDVEIHVHRGAGSYECGEETALIESLEGKRGQPRIKPPFPAVVGLYGCPTIVNNVETLVNVPLILTRGAEWFAAYGSEKNGGPKLYSISGHVARPGSYEAPMGKITLRDLIYGEGYAQGMKNGRKLKAVVPGGSSTPVLTASEIDVAMDFDGVAKAGSMLGSAGTIVMDDSTCMVWMAKNLIYFYKHESCGKCSPCREGTGWMLRLLERVEAGQAQAADLELLLKVADSIAGKTVCPFGDAADRPAPVDARQVPGRVRVPRPREALLEVGRTDVRGGAREERGHGVSPSPLVQELILAGVKIAVVVGTLLGLFSLMTWIERRTLAFMQYRLGPNRTGPLGILQPIADGIKLFFKEEVMPAAADKWAFLAAPVVAVATALLAVAVVPYGPPFTLPSWGLLPEFLRGPDDAGPDRHDRRGAAVHLRHHRARRLRHRARRLGGQQQVQPARRAALLGPDVLLRARPRPELGRDHHAGGLVPDQRHRRRPGTARSGAGSSAGTPSCSSPPSSSTSAPPPPRWPASPSTCPKARRSSWPGFHTEYSSMRFALIQMAEYINMITVAVLGTNLFLGGWHAGIPGLPSEGPPRVRLVGRQGGGHPLRVHLAARDAAPRALRPAHALRLEGAHPGGGGVDPGHRRRRRPSLGPLRGREPLMDAILFYVFAAVAVASALVVIGQRSPMYSAFALIVTLCSPERHLRAPRLAVHRRAAGDRLRRRDHGPVPLRAHAAQRQEGGGRAGARRARDARRRDGTRRASRVRGGRRAAALGPGRGAAVRRVHPDDGGDPLLGALPVRLRGHLSSSSSRRWWGRWCSPRRSSRAWTNRRSSSTPLLLSLVLFGLGTLGVFLRKNVITVLMCVELMLNGVNLAFVAFSRAAGTLDGQVLVFFVMVVAAAEAAVGLAIVIALNRTKDTLDVDVFNVMKG